MHEEEIYSRISEIASDVFGSPVTLQASTTADQVEGWDSLTNLDFMFAIEKEFGISFTTREVQGLANIGQLVAVIAAKN